MAKGTRGGKRVTTGGGATTITGQAIGGAQNQTQAQQPQVDNTQVAPAMSADYQKFMSMTDDEKSDFITSTTSQGVPSHLSDTALQRFIYNSNMNDKPDVVDDSVLDTMNGTELYRTVNSVYDRQNDISYSADQIARQVQAGRVTRTSDNGGSAYGRGIYFASDYGDSAMYGNKHNDIKQTAMMRCKLNSNAKIINYNSALSGLNSEIRSGSKLGKALSKLDRQSAVSIYSLSKGYNVITNGFSYFNVLNRNAITMSKDVKPVTKAYHW